jgi:hypothetical protein
MILTVDLLRSLFRNLAAWRSILESDGVDTLHSSEGSFNIEDIEWLYASSQKILPIRQRQAIRLCLLNNLTEEDAARIMKIDLNNPVAMYATSGLETLIHCYLFELLPTRRQYVAWETRNKSSNPQNLARILGKYLSQSSDRWAKPEGFSYASSLNDRYVENFTPDFGSSLKEVS